MKKKSCAPVAKEMTVVVCDCGCDTIYLELRDAEHRIMAVGGMSSLNATCLAAAIMEKVEQIEGAAPRRRLDS